MDCGPCECFKHARGGGACDDGDPTTAGDTCVLGQRVGYPSACGDTEAWARCHTAKSQKICEATDYPPMGLCLH